MHSVSMFTTLGLVSAIACSPTPRSVTPSSNPGGHTDAISPNGKAAIDAAIKGAHRLPANADRDRYRHPAETLAFFGLEPTMTVLDVDPGVGWYTELLAPALAKQGKYITTATRLRQPSNSESHWSAGASDAFAAFLARSPAVYGKVQTVYLDYEAPHLDLDGQVDMVLMIREVHMMRNWDTLGAWLAETFRALKPAGILGIVDHRAPAGTPPERCAKTGYIAEAWVIAQVEAAGFKLVGKSEVNANAKDTKDYPNGVWTLPPELYDGSVRRGSSPAARGDEARARYTAIGESDRMTLKFVKAVRAIP